MKVKYSLDKSFGPVGTAAGIFIFIAGLIATWYGPTGLILVLLGAFVGFTRSGSVIDFDNRQVKLAGYLFGIIETGKWIPIHEGMKLGIKKSANSWKAYSRSNRELSITDNSFTVMLFDRYNKKIMPVLKAKSSGLAKNELEKINTRLGLQVI